MVRASGYFPLTLLRESPYPNDGIRNIMFHNVNQDDCLIRGTHTRKGRTAWLNPDTKSVQHLHYGRVILDGDSAPLTFPTGMRETGLICLRGRATVEVGVERFELSRYDALYVPRDSEIRVSA